MKKILFILGPNLNMVGIRDVNTYGSETAESINEDVRKWAAELEIDLEIYQSNHEGDIIDKIHAAYGNKDGIIINAGALTHYSYALADAISSVHIPTVETHMSNIGAREEFRRKSVISPVCIGTIAGFGKYSYYLALKALIMHNA
ncbi:MAG: type II 3-dehydroquinate dehydratase [Clostridia bacterium]|nr:type II 3-dehydroquinate dehydratase [Clostridia bacterium]